PDPHRPGRARAAARLRRPTWLTRPSLPGSCETDDAQDVAGRSALETVDRAAAAAEGERRYADLHLVDEPARRQRWGGGVWPPPPQGGSSPHRNASSAPELEGVPARHRRELEQRASAARLGVAEVARVLVPGDLEQALLDAVVEPRAAEDELAQPVDERLAVHERHPLPVPDDVAPERGARLADAPVRGQLDEVAGLVLVQVVRLDQPQLHRGGRDALLEVLLVEAEAVAEELDDEVLAGHVVDVAWHARRVPSAP